MFTDSNNSVISFLLFEDTVDSHFVAFKLSTYLNSHLSFSVYFFLWSIVLS